MALTQLRSGQPNIYLGAVGLGAGVVCEMSWAMHGGTLKVTKLGGARLGMLMVVGLMFPPTLNSRVGVMLLGREIPGKPGEPTLWIGRDGMGTGGKPGGISMESGSTKIPRRNSGKTRRA